MSSPARPRGEKVSGAPFGPPKAWSERLYSKHRRAWLQMRDLDVALFVGYETSDPEGDARFGQDAIGMKITSPGRQTLWLNLTHYSEEELVSLKTILNVALDAAIPVARSVDEAAQRELDSGAESVSPRLFRIRPMLILRDIAAKLAPTDNNNKETDEHDPLGSELAGESTPG